MDNFFSIFADDDEDTPYKRLMGVSTQRDKTLQIILSVGLGLTAFLGFCVLRPRWTGLYAARKKHKNEANALPELPDSLFGWILPLWRINDQQILASAGLDAYAFLLFFKMAMKYLLITFFFSLIIIKPVHDANPDDDDSGKNSTKHHNGDKKEPTWLPQNSTLPYLPEYWETDYLWMYVVFAYLFSAIAVYLIITHTRRMIEVRQEYLGAQTSVTDRTIRLSGIPSDLQEEEKIKEFIEFLDIGKVESVTLCRNWKELDDAMDERMQTLRRLEEAYTIYQGFRRVERNLESLPISQPSPPNPRPTSNGDNADESATLLETNEGASPVPYDRVRPQTKLRYGFLWLRYKRIDAIDFYEEKLRQTDERIRALRKKEFAPMPLAFVTMDSVAASQMAVQAVLDPSPQHLIANQSPAPADVVWQNTYLTRRSRIIRAWSVSALIVLLTVFWSAIQVPIAGLLTSETIGKVFPQLKEVLKDHKNIRSLISTQLPTLFASLLMVLVPYLYYWLSSYQGMISQGDVELSAISKNFFFTFFNFFVVFTILGTASNFYTFFNDVGDTIRDFRRISYMLALSLQHLLDFYVNFIILQGLGLFPLRLLEIGSVSLYPVYRMGAKTPRDYAELVQPPMFNYGFYLPNALLIFIICMAYSVLRSSWQVLLAGVIYFAFGHFVYKYQLLYAMDHQQQATGRAWGMICDRVYVGLIFFQLTTTGQLVLKNEPARSALMIPLVAATIWISIVYGRTYKPLMQFIALRSVKRGEHYAENPSGPSSPANISSPAEPDDDSMAGSTNSASLMPERNVWADNDGASHLKYPRETRRGIVREDSEDTGSMTPRFINPSLVVPLEKVWIKSANQRRPNNDAETPSVGDESV